MLQKRVDEQRWKELLDALRVIAASQRFLHQSIEALSQILIQPVQRQEDTTTKRNISAQKHTPPQPQPAIRVLAQLDNTLVETYNRDQQKTEYFQRDTQKFQGRYMIVQWCLFGATAAAFCAAAYYAYVAGMQKEAMEQQWMTMDDTLTEVIRQTTSAQKAATATKKSADTAADALKATKEFNRINLDALISVQRAFVWFGQGLEENGLVDNEHRVPFWEFKVRLENSGATPARDATNNMSADVLPGPMPDNFDFSDTRPGYFPTHFILGPKQSSNGAVLRISTSDLWLVQQHKVHMYFWGWVMYRDVFPNTPVHLTMFCTELTEVRGDPSAVHGDPSTVRGPGFLYSACERHNCSDDDCNGEPADPRKVPRLVAPPPR